MSKLFNIEQEQFIKENYKGILVPDLVKMLNEKFRTKYNCRQIKEYKIKHGLKSGVNTKFKVRGHNPRHKCVGSEFTGPNGYTYIKIAEPNKWVHKQDYIWEMHNGKIPKGHSVVFLDQNKSNFDITNLMLIENRNKLVCKNKKMFFQNKEMTKAGILIAQLSNKLYDIKKEGIKC